MRDLDLLDRLDTALQTAVRIRSGEANLYADAIEELIACYRTIEALEKCSRQLELELEPAGGAA